jgi:hypothetical protein
MALSVAYLIASADTSGEALRLLRAALNLTQADLVAPRRRCHWHGPGFAH